MNLKKIIIAVAIVATALPTFAQYADDAFLFSGAKNSATARFNGLGGGHTAVGGDLTSLYGNPAGLGMFTKSEFSFTPSFNINNNETSFLGTNTTQSTSHINLNNMGIVFNSPVAKTSNLTKGVLSFNFGIGYQKTNFFKNNLDFNGGITLNNGVGEYLADLAYAENAKPNELQGEVALAAYDNFLINADSKDKTLYYSNTSASTNQMFKLNSKGNQSNVDFALGLNVSNKLYLGTSFSLSSINYRTTNVLNEKGTTPIDNVIYNYNVNLSNYYDTQASGVNFKLGAIFKPVYEFRIGLALETPTWYAIKNDAKQELRLLDNGNVNASDNYPFDYRVSTPLKLNGGLAYFFGKRGFISASINFVDYSSIKVKSSSTAIDTNEPSYVRTIQNSQNILSNNYKEAINYNIGAEFKLIDNLMIRAGYASRGNPYSNVKYSNFKSESYSGGLGYKFGTYYIDGALVVNNSNVISEYSNYTLGRNNEPFGSAKTTTTNISLTFGARF